jgi:hypothetical protein
MGAGAAVAFVFIATFALIMVTYRMGYGPKRKELASEDRTAIAAGPRRHKHEWRYHSSEFNPPTGNTWKGNGYQIFDLNEKAHWGFTNITYTCAVDECTEVQVKTINGRVSDPYQGKEYKP